MGKNRGWGGEEGRERRDWEGVEEHELGRGRGGRSEEAKGRGGGEREISHLPMGL